MVDSGASTIFLDEAWARSNFVPIVEKLIHEPIFAINNTPVLGGSHRTQGVVLQVGSSRLAWVMEIANIAHYPVVLGIEWLCRFGPNIDWKLNELRIQEDLIPLIAPSEIRETPRGSNLAAAAPSFPPQYLEFKSLFKKSAADVLPKPSRWDHHIPLIPGTEPPFGPVYGMSPLELNSLKEYIDDMLAKGFIQRSESPAGSPVIFVKKKDGSLRLCVDYRGLNAITVKNRTPLPFINETLDQIWDAKIYTRLDLRGAYNLLRMRKGEEWKTAFRTRYGLFEYLVMPFGLTNAPAFFQAMINDVLRPILDQYVVLYLDNILIFSRNVAEHEAHVKDVLCRLSQFDLFVKAEKCEWHVTKTEFLGYVISPEGISMSENKVQAITDWPTPKSKHDIQVFMGFCNFYRRFIINFAKISKPMYELTGGIPWNWTNRCETAFQTLKQMFISAPFLRHFDPDQPSILETDASNYAVGAILSQLSPTDNKIHPVAYFAKSMSPAELNYEIYDKELLGIVMAFKEWRTYLENSEHPVEVCTDHKNLEYFTISKVLNQRQARWSEVLSRYNFKIKYISGTSNKADALSRRPDLKPANTNDEQKPLLPKLLWLRATISPSDYDNNPEVNLPNPLGDELTLKEGIVYKGVQIYPPLNEEICSDIIRSKHDKPLAGHGGITRTFDLVSREYWWPSMRRDVQEFVSKCDLCQRTKTPRSLLPDYLQPLPILDTPWLSLSMDFIVKLPPSEGYNSILVVVDRLTKMSHFIPCNEATDAEGLARLFIAHIVRLHGLPRDIVSDRGATFKSKFWKALLQGLGVKPKFSTAFHPQMNGQTEHINQCLEQYLRCFINYKQDDWAAWLPLAEFQFNNSQNASSKISPFFANYGLHPRMTFNANLDHQPQNPAAQSLTSRIHKTQRQLDSELTLARATYKEFADKHRRAIPLYKIGDWVDLSNCHLQSHRPSTKLDHRFLGPFRIQGIVGLNSAFHLELPKTMRIHPMFHPCLLKPAAPPQRPLPPVIPQGDQSGTGICCKSITGPQDLPPSVRNPR